MKLNKKHSVAYYFLQNVSCTKHVGVKLPADLIAVLKIGKTVGVLATFSENDLLNITSIQCLYPKRLERILISINKEHTGYHNMV